jgi:hypothetical protein
MKGFSQFHLNKIGMGCILPLLTRFPASPGSHFGFVHFRYHAKSQKNHDRSASPVSNFAFQTSVMLQFIQLTEKVPVASCSSIQRTPFSIDMLVSLVT